MKNPTSALMLLVVCWARGDLRPPPSECKYASESGEYVLSVSPAKPGAPGTCWAELRSKDTVLWARHLIDNVAPAKAFVADSGQYIVTVDEWSRHSDRAITVYGPRGRLIAVHTMETYGVLRGYIASLPHRFPGTWWDNAIFFFGPKQEHFICRTDWGQTVVLRLWKGDVLDSARLIERGRVETASDLSELLKFADKYSSMWAMRAMNAQDPQQRAAGARIGGQLQIRESVPTLRRLLDDPAWSSLRDSAFVGTKRIFFVRKAAYESLQAMGVDVAAPLLEAFVD